MMIRTPLPFTNGIVAATVMGTIGVPLNLTLRPSGTASTYMTGVLGQMVWPIVPVCTVADQTGLYTLEIEGWDQFGDGQTGPGSKPFFELGNKTSATQVVTRFNFRAYSRIKRITVTPLNAAAAADTIEIGFMWDLTGTPLTRLPLPFKPRKQLVTANPTTYLGDWSPHVYCPSTGGATFASMTANSFVQVSTQDNAFVGIGPNSDAERSVIAINANWNGVADQTAPIDLLIGFRDHSDLIL